MGQWTPSIDVVAGRNGTVMGSFRPWDPKASFTKACLVEKGKSKCTGLFLLSHNQTNATFAEVPCNKTFILKLRSYNADRVPLQTFYWYSPNHAILPCAVNTTEPFVPQDNTPSKLLTIGVVSAIALILLIIGIVFLRVKKPELNKYLAVFCPPTCESASVVNNQHILPVYMQENEAYSRSVCAHIHLLNKTAGLNIRTYDEQRRDIQENKDTWTKENLKKCTAVLVYHSKFVDHLIYGNELPDDYSIMYADVCRIILRLLEKSEYEEKNVVHVGINVGENTSDIENVVKLVKIKRGKISIINTSSVIEKLTEVKGQSDPSEGETREFCRCVRELFGTTFTSSDDDDDVDVGPDTLLEIEPVLANFIPDEEYTIRHNKF